MEYRNIGNSDLKLSVITFGAWATGGWMWGHTDRKDAIEAIKVSYDLGVTSIDTAPIYGQGNSEEIVGEAIKDYNRDKVQLLTKFGMRWDMAEAHGDFAMDSTMNNGTAIKIYKYASKESIIKECEDSLKRLKTDYIDLYQQHWPESTTPISETMEALERLQEQGKILHFGVCNYDEKQVAVALKSTQKVVSNQVPFSMVNNGILSATLPYCMEHDLSIIAYSPLERGLLTGKMKPGQHFEVGDHRANNKFFTDEYILKTNKMLQNISLLAESKNATLSQVVLKWTISQPGVTIALAGARNAVQASLNAKAAMLHLTAEELDYISLQVKLYS